jgi:hypothetical protein
MGLSCVDLALAFPVRVKLRAYRGRKSCAWLDRPEGGRSAGNAPLPFILAEQFRFS